MTSLSNSESPVAARLVLPARQVRLFSVPLGLVKDSRLSAFDKGVYLCALAVGEKTGVAFLAETCGCSKTEILQALSNLVLAGWCHWDEERSAIVFDAGEVNMNETTAPVNPIVRPPGSRVFKPKPPMPPPPEPKKPRKRKPAVIPPAVEAVREVTKRYPAKALWETVVDIVGDNPDKELMEECYTQWLIRGYSPVSIGWLDHYSKRAALSKSEDEHEIQALWNTLMEAARLSPDYRDRAAYEKHKEAFLLTLKNRGVGEIVTQQYEQSPAFAERFGGQNEQKE